MKKFVVKMFIILMGVFVLPHEGKGMETVPPGTNENVKKLLGYIKDNKLTELQSTLATLNTSPSVKKAVLDFTDKNKQTLLHFAATRANFAATQLLIAHGADINAKDNKTQTPYDIARLDIKPASSAIFFKNTSQANRLAFILHPPFSITATPDTKLPTGYTGSGYPPNTIELSTRARISRHQYAKMVMFMEWSRDGLEIEGNLFGRWNSGIPVIEFVYGPGDDSYRTVTHTKPGLKTLLAIGNYMQSLGVEHVGHWHSHHTLLTFLTPSDGDFGTIKGQMNEPLDVTGTTRTLYLECIGVYAPATILRPYIFRKPGGTTIPTMHLVNWHFDESLDQTSFDNEIKVLFNEKNFINNDDKSLFFPNAKQRFLEQLVLLKKIYPDFSSINNQFNYQAYKNVTLLHVAVIENNLEAVQVLLELGANLNITDQFGRTPLYYAGLKWKKPIVDLLVSAGAKISEKEIADVTTDGTPKAQSSEAAGKFFAAIIASLNSVKITPAPPKVPTPTPEPTPVPGTKTNEEWFGHVYITIGDPGLFKTRLSEAITAGFNVDYKSTKQNKTLWELAVPSHYPTIRKIIEDAKKPAPEADNKLVLALGNLKTQLNALKKALGDL